MCAGCITAVDVGVYGMIGLGGAVEAGIDCVRSLIDGRFAAQRSGRVWERNADFCAYLGLDAAEVLGPKPLPQLVIAGRQSTRSPGLALMPAT
jgi:hypothetical protein